MRVLVIIVLYNGMRWVERCLSSVATWDAVVVDNGSTDGGPEYIEAHFPNVRLIRSEDNLGFGAANNIGLKIAIKESYDYVYLLNQDAWLESDTIEHLIAVWSKDYGILSPLQCAADGSLDKNFKRKCGKFIQRSSNLIAEIPFVMAAHWLLSIETIKLVGGFSPSFKQYGEDDNYIDRLHYWGLKCGIVSDARAVHDRAMRIEDKHKRLQLKCIASVVRVSNPCKAFALSAILEPIRLVATALKNGSTIPLIYIPKLYKRYEELSQYRSASMQKGAFL